MDVPAKNAVRYVMQVFKFHLTIMSIENEVFPIASTQHNALVSLTKNYPEVNCILLKKDLW